MHTKNEVLADRQRLDRLWTEEADDRIKAFKQGEFEAIPMEKVFAKINC